MDFNKVFGPGGYLAAAIEGYESRPGQVDMAKLVDNIVQNGGIATIEGPCGIGKSVAYGVPAINYVSRGTNDDPRKVVIVTQNIALQEQLARKDLPMLADALPMPFSYALLKGRGNFLCKHRVVEHKEHQEREGRSNNTYQFGLYEAEHVEQAHALMAWAETTSNGDVADSVECPVHAPTVWEKFSRDKNDCLGKSCKFFKQHQCWYYNHRNDAWKADVIVTNYHLLMAHLQVMEKTDRHLVLPEFDVLICDEAHDMEHIVREALGFTLAPSSFSRLISYVQTLRIAGGVGKLIEALRTCRDTFFQAARDRYSAEHVIAPAFRRDHYFFDGNDNAVLTPEGRTKIMEVTGVTAVTDNLERETLRALEILHELRMEEIQDAQLTGREPFLSIKLPRLFEDKQLLDPTPLLAVLETVRGHTQGVVAQLTGRAADLNADVGQRKALAAAGVGTKLAESDEVALATASAVLRNVDDLSEKLKEFSVQGDPAKAYWIEVGQHQVRLKAALIDVAQALQSRLYSTVHAVVLTSATMTASGNFNFINQTLGAQNARTLIAKSPFNFGVQARVFIAPRGLVPDNPNAADFDERSIEVFKMVIDACQGRTLGLFTSNRSLQVVAEGLCDEHSFYNGFQVFVQGQMDRNLLVNAFRDDVSSVLLGVRSFWQGIDVPGEALSALVIHRLPFPSPEDPIAAAVRKRYAARGANPFYAYDVPVMLIALNQMVGRLIRRKDDVGVVVFVDRRTMTKNYGEAIYRSLPIKTNWVHDFQQIAPFLASAKQQVARLP